MDRQTIIVLGGFFAIMIGSAAVNSLTTDPFVRGYAFPIFMGVFVAFIVGQDLAYRLAAAELLCLRMLIRPSGEKLWLWAKTIETHTNLSGGGYSTVVKLAFPSRDLNPYGKLRTLIINSKIPPNKAIKWGPGDVLYKDTQIKHGRMTEIVVEQQEMGASNLERGFAEPVFYLREATNYIKAATLPIGSLQDTAKVSELENALAQKTYEAENNHKLRLVAEEMVEKLQNELQARIGLDFDVNKLALIKIMTLLKLVQQLERVADMLGRRTVSTYIKWLIPGLIAVIVFLFFYTQPQLWARLELWLSNPLNQAYALLMVAVAVVVLFLLRRWMRRRGQ